MKRLVVTWADPGMATGWSVHSVPIDLLLREGQVGAVRGMKWKTGQFRFSNTTDSVDAYLALCRKVYEELTDEEDVFVMGTEGFTLMMLSTDYALLEPVRFNAVLRDRLVGTGQTVEEQQPSERTVITDQRLQLWGLYRPGAEHARDAQRHGLVFLRRFASQPKLRARLGWEG